MTMMEYWILSDVPVWIGESENENKKADLSDNHSLTRNFINVNAVGLFSTLIHVFIISFSLTSSLIPVAFLHPFILPFDAGQVHHFVIMINVLNYFSVQVCMMQDSESNQLRL